MPDTLTDLLARGAAEAVAIAAPGRQPLTHGALRALIQRTLAVLNAGGIGRNDRVGIVLPNGPEMATCFMACASGVASAPLNPAYRADEFEFYLSDLHAKALIVETGSTSPAVEVAKKLGVAVIELQPAEAAGDFTLTGLPAGTPSAQGGYAQPADVSMVLHTSGTTSRPKIVPLSQGNLAASAENIRATLQFTAADCGLNIMPLFHIHGLIAGVLAPLAAGSQVFCTPGFNALKFFGWMDEARPTWYTAVPTMHQAIIARAPKNLDVIARHPLRFMRSSSSSMPPQVIAELEAIFKAPLIEAYGMTEATHQMCSNPLPPAVRKPGSVGLPAGPEVAIMGEDGRLLPREKLETLWQAHVQTGPMGYGYLFSVGDRPGRRFVGHNGGAPGISAEFLHYPDHGLAIVVLANQDHAAEPMREWLQAQVEAALFGTETP